MDNRNVPAQVEKSRTNSKRLIVELVGPAGSGKTTLARKLVENNQNVRLVKAPDLQKKDNIPFFIRNTILILPLVFQLLLKEKGRMLTRREMEILILLKGWLPKLKNQEGVLLLDQGPISLLGFLDSFGTPRIKSQTGKNWVTQSCKDMARSLDLIIVLDAPNEILVDRVQNRAKNHGIKQKTYEESCKFLDGYRSAFDQIFSIMAGETHQPKIFQYNTDRNTPERLYEGVNAVIRSELNECGEHGEPHEFIADHH